METLHLPGSCRTDGRCSPAAAEAHSRTRPNGHSRPLWQMLSTLIAEQLCPGSSMELHCLSKRRLIREPNKNKGYTIRLLLFTSAPSRCVTPVKAALLTLSDLLPPCLPLEAKPQLWSCPLQNAAACHTRAHNPELVTHHKNKDAQLYHLLLTALHSQLDNLEAAASTRIQRQGVILIIIFAAVAFVRFSEHGAHFCAIAKRSQHFS